MPSEQIRIERIEDLYYYYNLLEESRVDEQSVEIALNDFINNFDIVTSYNDNLDRLKGHVDVDIATAIIKFQEFVNKLYKVIKYQDQDISLTEQELNSIKVYIKVDDGSSILKYAKAIAKIFNKVTETMSAKEKILMATLLTSVITVTGSVAYIYSKYIDSEERIALSQEETQRQNNIINGFSKLHSAIDNNIIYKTVEKEGKKAILEPVKNSDNVTYSISSENNESLNSTINKEDAKEILKNTRTTAITEVFESQFKINGITNSSEQGKVIVQISTNDDALNGNVKISKDQEDIDYTKIVNSFRDEQLIKLVVKTKTLHGTTKIDKIIATVGELSNN